MTNLSARARARARALASLSLALAALGAAACSSDPSTSTTTGPSPVPAAAPSPTTTPNDAPGSAPKANPTGDGATISTHIDNASGGTVALPNGTTIDVPPGALPPGVDTISVTSSTAAAPTEYTALSPVYVFGPDGTVFLKPLTITIPVTLPSGMDTSTLTILWSRANGVGFDMIPSDFSPASGSSTDFFASGEVTHFSQGFCGLKYTTDPHPATDAYGK
jgi:hypothetical protein